MDPRTLARLLQRVASGALSPEDALETLRHLPESEVPEGQARLDTHRQLRTGHPEVVFGESKTIEQLLAIVRRLGELEHLVLVTRVDEEKGRRLSEEFPRGTHDPLSRTFVVRHGRRARPRGRPVLVVSAGTSDAAVAEEAALTAELMGARVERIHDVGVAGLHRVTRHRPRLEAAGVIVVVAGMEGALPSVVAGLTGRPVIAVPTSVGYGAAFHGLAALLGMLNSCAPGVSVVNIDNGFGAGRLAAQIAREMR